MHNVCRLIEAFFILSLGTNSTWQFQKHRHSSPWITAPSPTHYRHLNGCYPPAQLRLDSGKKFCQRAVLQWHSCLWSGVVTIPGGVPEPWRCGTEGRGQWAWWGGLGLGMGISEAFSHRDGSMQQMHVAGRQLTWAHDIQLEMPPAKLLAWHPCSSSSVPSPADEIQAFVTGVNKWLG